MSVADAAVEDFRKLRDEALALRRASRSLGAAARQSVERLVRANAVTEAAIAILHTALPDCGFKLVSPPAPGPRESYATIWRAGDVRGTSGRAPTPAGALLVAIEAEHTRRLADKRRAACPDCGGLGWFVSTAGTKHLCRHHQRRTIEPEKIAAPGGRPGAAGPYGSCA